MTPKQLEALIAHLNASGALSFKGMGIEITFATPAGLLQVDHKTPKRVKKITNPKPHPEIPKPSPELEPVPHKDERLESIMKLSDNELLDQLFPDNTSPEEP